MLNFFKQFGSQSVVYGIGQVVASSAAIFLIPLYTRQFSTTEYGIVSLLLTSHAFALTIFAVGLPSALLRSFYDYDDIGGKSKVVSSALILALISSLVMILLGWLIRDYLSHLIFGTTDWANAVFFTLFSVAFQINFEIPFAVLRAIQKARIFVLLNTGLLALRIILIIAFIAYLNWNIWGVVWGYFIASLVIAPFIFSSIKKYINWQWSKTEAKKMFRFGFPAMIAGLSSIILVGADRYFLRQYHGLAVTGVYTLGYQIGLIVQVLFVAPIILVWPNIMLPVFKESFAGFFFSRTLTYTLYIGGFLALILSLFAPYIIFILATPEYLGASIVVPFISVSYLFMLVQRIFAVGTETSRKMGRYATWFLIASGLNLILNYILIPPFGMLGAALATFLSYLTLPILSYLFSQPLYKIKYEWSRLFLISMIFLICLLANHYFHSSNISINFVYKSLILLVYLLLAILGLKVDERTYLINSGIRFIRN